MCIIHYDIKDAKYSKLKKISDINKDRISNAKILREREGGLRYHKQQCKSIPEEIDDSKHGIHLEPCYKKFTFILLQLNFHINQNACLLIRSVQEIYIKRNVNSARSTE